METDDKSGGIKIVNCRLQQNGAELRHVPDEVARMQVRRCEVEDGRASSHLVNIDTQYAYVRCPEYISTLPGSNRSNPGLFTLDSFPTVGATGGIKGEMDGLEGANIEVNSSKLPKEIRGLRFCHAPCSNRIPDLRCVYKISDKSFRIIENL